MPHSPSRVTPRRGLTARTIRGSLPARGFVVASMSRLKFKIIRYSLLAYVLLTLWQIIDKREDFPLSSFPMFSHALSFPGVARRAVLVGVNEHGEVRFDPDEVSALMSAVRLRQIFQLVRKKSDAQQAEFMHR